MFEQIKCGRLGSVLHLREGSRVLGVEVVERLVKLALRHVAESLTSCLHQEQLLGILQLDAAHALPDPPQAASCRQNQRSDKSNGGGRLIRPGQASRDRRLRRG